MTLTSPWTLAFGPQHPGSPGDWAAVLAAGWPVIAATVPGNVELDLLAAGQIRDPAVGTRVQDLRRLESGRWFYRTTFAASALAPGSRADLVFEGLDCLATVWVNGHVVGTAANMLIPHRFDVSALLRPDDGNELVVRLDSAVLAGQRHMPSPGEFANAVNWEALTVRKAPHMYGWDILPRLVSAGIWRPVRLEIVAATAWRQVYWTTLRTDPAEDRADLLVDWDFQTERTDLDALAVRFTLMRQGRCCHASTHDVTGTHGRTRLQLSGVALWWPRGSGEPALHDARIELLDAEGRVLAADTARIGLRTVRLLRTDTTREEAPGEFVFVVNGERVFMRGTNWVPLDSLHSRDPLHLPAAMAMLADLNCNMVRCWGGNVYEDHAFFDRCDELGILVWQDFALACSIYPQDDAFAAVIRAEAEAVVARLRNHPSLALWAGNNEIDEAYQWAGMGTDPNSDRLSRQVLPAVVRRLDPLRDYLPSSPYRSPALVAAGNADELKPEDHLWGPRGDFKGACYTGSPAHFVSEIGYHGCPCRASLEQMMEPGHVWPWRGNEQWLTHAVRPVPGFKAYDYRIELMARQILILFAAEPEALDDFIFASQVVQAEALKFFIERFRMGKWRRTGLLWWNLRDGWPVISDAIVDYYNRPKLAYAVVKRVQADVCVMLAEPADGRHGIVLVNDRRREVTGTFTVTDADTGAVLGAGDFRVPANSTAMAGAVPAPARPSMFLLEWREEGRSHVSHYLAGPRPFALADVQRWYGQSGIAAEREAAEATFARS